jgi:hypothetical protein
MKILLFVILIVCYSCAPMRDVDEYERYNAKLISQEKLERVIPALSEGDLIYLQTWQFVQDHHQIFEYVTAFDTLAVGTLMRKDRKR